MGRGGTAGTGEPEGRKTLSCCRETALDPPRGSRIEYDSGKNYGTPLSGVGDSTPLVCPAFR